MSGDNLVIVESPAKAQTVEKFLGDGFLVKSSFGHIRDLDKKGFGVDIKNKYKPSYIVPSDKKKVVSELKKLAKSAVKVWLASDEDREGEAIAWHLTEVLGLEESKVNRIVFHEITKDAIQNAVKTPRQLNKNLVDAQQARRVLDRLVGFEISPVLWRKVKPSLSAGRVQSVAVRLIVEREREINRFKSTSSFRVVAEFDVNNGQGKAVILKAELSKRFSTADEVRAFLEKCKSAKFEVSDIVKKPSKKSPSPPFITSTLQQEASRKLGFPVGMTMSVAQKLYEAGKITYMRTDSTTLSELAVKAAKKKVEELYGSNYFRYRKFKTKAKGAQEAHEAIRPTDIGQEQVGGTSQEQRLYRLIWKRAVASQMADAKLEKTTVSINISNSDETFVAVGEVLKFDGFLSVYSESSDNDNVGAEEKSGLLPPLNISQELSRVIIEANQRFSQKPSRYTEASLVRKLEELGIGRPSTYAPTITTIQHRKYVVKEDRPGVERKYYSLTLSESDIKEKEKSEVTGAEKAKLFPTDVGMVVNDFLLKYFAPIVDYSFTASVEKEFDEIAMGNMVWYEMIDRFYHPFHEKIENALSVGERSTGERVLGEDPVTGKPVSVKIGRYGAFAQLGKISEDEEEKPRLANLRAGQSIETISLEEALELFKLPREVGEYEDKKVVIGIGRFGPYIRHDGKFTSLKKDEDDPFTIDLNRSIELIEEKREKDRKAIIKVFDVDPEIKILHGRWGPYISCDKKNYKIPKSTDAESLTLEDCKKIIDKGPAPRRGAKRKS